MIDNLISLAMLSYVLIGVSSFLLWYILNDDNRKHIKNYGHYIYEIMNYYTFSWYGSRLIPKKRKKKFSGLYDDFSTKQTNALFRAEWKQRLESFEKTEEKSNNYPSLLGALYAVFGTTFNTAFVLKLVGTCIEFARPYLLSCIINELSALNTSFINLLAYTVILFLDMEALSLIENAHTDIMCGMGIKVQSCLIAAVYEKMLYLTYAERQNRSMGEIVNLMSIDIEHFQELTSQVHTFVIGPVKIIFALVYLYLLIGISAIPGVLIILLFFPLHTLISDKYKVYMHSQRSLKDQRAKAINELLTNMKTIKLNVLEDVVYNQIDSLREQELSFIKKYVYLKIFIDIYNVAVPFVVPLVSFATLAYTARSESMSLDVILVCMTLFNQMRNPLGQIAHLMNVAVQASVSNDRLCSFLSSNESKLSFKAENESTDIALQMNNLQATWINNHQFSLGVNDLIVRKGHTVVVSGSVGSGKSSFLHAILGCLESSAGLCRVDGSVAYVSQEAWIRNTTIRENILFGSLYNNEKYSNIVSICRLTVDFEDMKDGDNTMVGYKGSNLSGGQKSRIALARALYQDCDIYLLDDPLAAIDIRVSDQIISKLFGNDGFLNSKTVIIASHSDKILSLADIWLNFVDGKAEFKEIAVITKSSHLERAETSKMQETDPCRSKVPEPTVTEEIGSLNKKSSPMLSYIASMGYLDFSFFVISCCVFNYVQHASNFSITSLAQNLSKPESYFHALFLGIVEVTLFAVSSIVLLKCSETASRLIQRKLLGGILQSEVGKLSEIPAGEITSTCSKDMNSVDYSLPANIKNIAVCFLQVFVTLIGLFSVSPTFLVILLPLGVFYWKLVTLYVPTSEELRTLMSSSKSQVYAHFSESMDGAITIRAFHKETEFRYQSAALVDDYIKSKYSHILCNRWLSVRLDLIGSLVVFATACGAILAKMMNLNPNTAALGICITYGMNLTNVLSFSLKQLSNLHSKIHSVDRIDNLCHFLVEDGKQTSSSIQSWIPTGKITFRYFSAKYNTKQELALKSINLTVLPGEKIGIVGRTGSGKSSLIMSIFRMLKVVSGSIEIDSVNTEEIPLNILRRSMTIISQDLFTLSGSIRSILDPFCKNSDEAVWEALSLVQMKDSVQILPGALQYNFSEGSEFSVGQRQLLALAGALLKKNRILVLDEATSAMDNQTELLVQDTIEKHFSECTVLTIAHRLKTVEQCSRILVVDNGEIIRDAKPQEILMEYNTKKKQYSPLEEDF